MGASKSKPASQVGPAAPQSAHPTEIEVQKARIQRQMKQIQRDISAAEAACKQFKAQAEQFAASGDDQMAIFYLQYAEIARENVRPFNDQYLALLKNLNDFKFAAASKDVLDALQAMHVQINAEKFQHQQEQIQQLNQFIGQSHAQLLQCAPDWTAQAAQIDVDEEFQKLKARMGGDQAVKSAAVTAGEVEGQEHRREALAICK